jgi:hypothetical protein
MKEVLRGAQKAHRAALDRAVIASVQAALIHQAKV